MENKISEKSKDLSGPKIINFMQWLGSCKFCESFSQGMACKPLGSKDGCLSKIISLICYTIFCDLPKINWFVVPNFCNQDVSYLENKISETSKDLSGANSICNDEALANLAKVSHMPVKVVLHYQYMVLSEYKYSLDFFFVYWILTYDDTVGIDKDVWKSVM